MTLAWLQLSYRQTEAYSFSTETAVAFITAKIVASFRDTACCHRNRRFQLQKAVTFYLCAGTVYFSAIGTKAFCACAALESLLWFVTFWPICNESLIEICCDQRSLRVLIPRGDLPRIKHFVLLSGIILVRMDGTVSIAVTKGVFVRCVCRIGSR